nr:MULTISPECIES: hypothetical protein [Aeromonas]
MLYRSERGCGGGSYGLLTIFHKAWKTGAGAERQRMEDPDNLERMVSILSFVAVRLLQLRESFTLPQELRAQGLLREAEHVEHQSCETVLTKDESVIPHLILLFSVLDGDRPF